MTVCTVTLSVYMTCDTVCDQSIAYLKVKKITSSHFAVFYFYKISRVVTFYTLIPVLRLCDYYLRG